jgi:hypothetical protein
LAVANGCRLGYPLHITDQLEMLSLMGHNVLLNNAKGRVKPSVLNWCVKTCSRPYYSLPHAYRRPQIPTTLPPFVPLRDGQNTRDHLSIGYAGDMQRHALLPYRVPPPVP